MIQIESISGASKIDRIWSIFTTISIPASSDHSERIDLFWEQYLRGDPIAKLSAHLYRLIDDPRKEGHPLFLENSQIRYGSRRILQVAACYPISKKFWASWLQRTPSRHDHQELWLRMVWNCKDPEMIRFFWKEWSLVERTITTEDAIVTMVNLCQCGPIGTLTDKQALRNLQTAIECHPDLWQQDHPGLLRDRVRAAAVCCIEYRVSYFPEKREWAGTLLPIVTWILQEHPIAIDLGSWKLLNDVIIADVPTSLFLMEHTRDKDLQLWVDLQSPNSNCDRVVVSLYWKELLGIDGEPVVAVRIHGIYLYLLERGYRFVGDPNDPNLGFRLSHPNFWAPVPIDLSPEYALVEYGLDFQEQVWIALPRIIARAVKENLTRRKSARAIV